MFQSKSSWTAMFVYTKLILMEKSKYEIFISKTQMSAIPTSKILLKF